MKSLLPTHVRHGMGTVILFGISLLLAGPSSASASVEVITCEASSQKARITIELNGRRTEDVQMIISSFGGRPFQTSVTVDASGLVVLPRLAAGQYMVTARAPENQSGSICVEISKKKSKEVSSFWLTLHPVPAGSSTLEQMLAGAEQDAPTEQIQQFQGVVVDPRGATIASTEIKIFPKGARVRDDKHSVKVKSSSKGDFSVTLPDGVYTAVFMRSGFKQKIVTFQILRTSVATGMRITPQLGEVT